MLADKNLAMVAYDINLQCEGIFNAFPFFESVHVQFNKAGFEGQIMQIADLLHF